MCMHIYIWAHPARGLILRGVLRALQLGPAHACGGGPFVHACVSALRSPLAGPLHRSAQTGSYRQVTQIKSKWAAADWSGMWPLASGLQMRTRVVRAPPQRNMRSLLTRLACYWHCALFTPINHFGSNKAGTGHHGHRASWSSQHIKIKYFLFLAVPPFDTRHASDIDTSETVIFCTQDAHESQLNTCL